MKKMLLLITILVLGFVYYNFTVFNGTDVHNDTEGLTQYFEDLKKQDGQVLLTDYVREGARSFYYVSKRDEKPSTRRAGTYVKYHETFISFLLNRSENYASHEKGTQLVFRDAEGKTISVAYFDEIEIDFRSLSLSDAFDIDVLLCYKSADSNQIKKFEVN